MTLDPRLALAVFFGVFFGCLFLEPFILGVLSLFGVYAVVKENEARVYVLFGNVLGVIKEPGLHFLWLRLGPGALIVNFFGQCHVRDLRLDQEYIRSNPVNSEEGAPIGIGVWYEMMITDPVAHVFKNIDPRGSLHANVSNATVRCLSNLKLADMLTDRHSMSQTVREEVSSDARQWGYKVGSVYVRKVHFRDAGMVRQIEEKVVNRLRQVTSAIRQDGANQVSIITSTAEKEAAVEFARAAAIRSEIVGETLQQIGQDPEVADILFKILETQQTLDGEADIVVLPARSRQDLLTQWSVVQSTAVKPPPASK
jgi:regulator of protease activity HflC (stomatin/prohibitin superfamily)